MKRSAWMWAAAMAVVIGAMSTAARAQTTLGAGDIVILEFNGFGTDGFTFMPLVNLEAGTVIHFTDYGWNAAGPSFNVYEEGNPPTGGGNMITYTAPTSIAAGTFIRQNTANVGGAAFTANSDWLYNFGNPSAYNYIYALNSLNTGHDGLIAFQGTPTSPTFVWAYHTGQWGKGAYADNYWSDLPTGLTNGTTAVFFADLSSGDDLTVDDGFYSGDTTAASAATWRTRVADAANWTTSASGVAPALLSGPYTVWLAPTVTTTAVTVYTDSAATMAGNAAADGGQSITERGVVYSSTDSTPTIGEAGVTKDTNGTGTGTFSESISGLTASTTYYVRAYAINAIGTGYGAVQTFATSSSDPTATAPASGDGSSGDPYQIATLENLYWIADQVNNQSNDFAGKYFIQTANIDASSTSTWFSGAGWTPIYGDDAGHIWFSGVYDGQGYTISGLYINRLSSPGQALFGNVSGGTVKNLGVIDVSITGGGDSTGTVTGALAGYVFDGSTVTNCYSTGAVSGYSIVGGLIGMDDGSNAVDTVSHCYSTCSVTASDSSAGGLIGQSFASTTRFCYATGSVGGAGTPDGMGGLIGDGYGIVECCFATGDVSGGFQAAGLVGICDGTVTNSYATGDVVGSEDYPAGLVGTNNGTVSYSFATGTVTGAAPHKGGLIGANNGGGVADAHSFWNTDAIADGCGGQLGTFSAVGKTAAQLQNISTFTAAGWDFVGETANGTNDYWDIASGQYPRLVHGPGLVILSSDIPVSTAGPLSKAYATKTFTLTPAASNYVSMESADGLSGYYALDYDSVGPDGTEFTLSIENGYTFDLQSLRYYVDSTRLPTLTLTFTYADTSTDTQTCTFTGQSTGVYTLAGLLTKADDIVSVKVVSDQYINYNNFDIVDIQALGTAPTVTTDAASSISSTGATLNGTVNANGGSTTVTFEYGTTTAYGTTVTATQSPATGSSDTTVSKAITGLTPNTTYHYRVVGVNGVGTTNGSDATFATTAAVPTATTDAASSITSTGATLNGTINAKNASTTVTFEYGATTAYGTTVTATQSPATGTSDTSVSKAITGLTPATTYHYRVVGVNSAGTTNGSDTTFTTSNAAPTVASPSSSVTSSTAATLGGSVSAINGANVTERGVYWSTTDGFTPPGAGTKVSETGTWGSTGAFTVSATSLPAGSTVYFKAFATNSVGTTFTSQASFSTDKSDQTITFDALAAKTYGAATFDLSASSTSGLTVSFASSDSDVATISGVTVTIVGAGSTTITASQAGNGTYNAATSVERTLTVNKKTLTATADDKTRDYGVANPAFTVTYSGGFVGSDDASDLNTAPTAACAANASSVAGAYNIVPSGGSDNDYDFSYVNGTLTVTGIAATVTTPSSTVLSTTSATLGGTVSSTGGTAITERGVYWSTTDGFTPPGEGTKVSETGTWTATGAFTVSATGLPVGSTIYFKAFATNTTDTSFSSQSSLTTSKNNQTITFAALANKTFGDAAFDLTATASSGLGVTYTSSNTEVGTISGSTVTIVGVGSTTITASQTGNATYNAAANVERTLTVVAAPATVTTAGATLVTSTSASIVGNVTATGGGTVTTRGVCYATTSAPTISSSVVAVGSGAGEFTANLTGLTAGTTYYARAYATNASATAYGDEVSFATSSAVVTDDNGQATISNGEVNGVVDGFDPDLPVTLETDEDGATVLTVGDTDSPALATTLQNIGEDAEVSISIDPVTEEQTIEIAQTGGRKVTLVLVAFPSGANVGLDLGSEQILGSVTNAAGQVMDVTIETTDSGGDVTFIVTWHAPNSNPVGKTVWSTPSGSMTVEAEGLAEGATTTIRLSYADMDLGDVAESELRMLKLDGEGNFVMAGTSDKGSALPTGVLGDTGVDLAGKTVWVETGTLGTFAVGVPVEADDVITVVKTQYGCMAIGALLLNMLMVAFCVLNGRDD